MYLTISMVESSPNYKTFVYKKSYNTCRYLQNMHLYVDTKNFVLCILN